MDVFVAPPLGRRKSRVFARLGAIVSLCGLAAMSAPAIAGAIPVRLPGAHRPSPGLVRQTDKQLTLPRESQSHSVTGTAAGSPLIRLGYTLVQDSGGGHPNPGAEVDLLFAASGEAFLYLADAKEALGYQGTYSYSGAQLSLHIVSSDFKADATFPLSITASQVNMPFKVFSSGKGTSLWDRETPDLETGIMAVYNAAMNPSTSSISPALATDQAFAYAQAWLGSPAPSQAGADTTDVRRGAQQALHTR